MALYDARQSVYVSGDTILAAHSNDELDRILAAFNKTTGHLHDGSTTGDGPKLVVLGAVNSGSITSGFGTIDIGSSTFGTTGTITGPSGTWDSGGMDIATGDTYAIASTNVLNATTLGTAVVTSSLTTVGALNSGSITSGFGTIDTGSSNISTSGTLTTGTANLDGTVNINGSAAAVDFTVKGDNNTQLIFLDGSQDAISLGGANIDGAALIINNLTDRTAATSVGQQVHIPAQTQNFDNASSTIAIGTANFIGIPTMTGSNATLTMTNAATLYIQGAPVAGSNVAHTTAGYSLWVDAGGVRFDGTSTLSGTVTGPSGTWDSGGMDIAASDTYAIDGTDVLTATTLGTAVITSSLTTVGALNSGSITSGFGTIDNGTSNIITGGIIKLDVDGSAENAAGSLTMGAGNDAGIYFDGTNAVFITNGAGASGIILDSEDDTLEIKGSGTLQATFDTGGLDLVTGDAYEINNTSVLNATTLGGAVVNSSLTSVGTITTGVWGGTDITVANGGTGVSTLTSGGILLGSGADPITAMAVLANSEMIVGDGTTDPVAESGVTLRESIGLETGTFTPGVAFGGNAVSVTYSQQGGFYWKFGDLVHIQGRVTLTSNGSSTGAVTFTGIPYETDSGAGNRAVATISQLYNIDINTGGNFHSVTLSFGDAATTGQFYEEIDNGNPVTLTEADFADNADFRYAMTYISRTP